MFVKICGITNEDDALLAVAMGADAVGFVFAPSPRQLTAVEAARLAREAPAGLERVGVFAGDVPPFAAALLEAGIIHTVQADAAALARLDGSVPEARRLPVFHDGEGVEREIELAGAHRTPRARVLFEGRASGRGVAPDWERAARLARRVRLVLAGGLTPANVAEAVRRVGPAMVDVSSGVESAPGRKDPGRIREFVEQARAAGPSPDGDDEERR